MAPPAGAGVAALTPASSSAFVVGDSDVGAEVDRDRMVRRRSVEVVTVGEALLRHPEVLHRRAVRDDPGAGRLPLGLFLDRLDDLRDGADVGVEIAAVDPVHHVMRRRRRNAHADRSGPAARNGPSGRSFSYARRPAPRRHGRNRPRRCGRSRPQPPRRGYRSRRPSARWRWSESDRDSMQRCSCRILPALTDCVHEVAERGQGERSRRTPMDSCAPLARGAVSRP